MSLPLQSFAPILDERTRVLVLGSMPGVISLAQHQYYAHPRNAFWPLMAAIFGVNTQDSYARRCEALKACGVGVWDVLQTCERSGSLDADIKTESMVPNDFQRLFASYPGIQRVCFNGAKAASVYQRYVAPHIVSTHALHYVSLPSTSPAHAALSFEKKLDIWRPALLPSIE